MNHLMGGARNPMDGDDWQSNSTDLPELGEDGCSSSAQARRLDVSQRHSHAGRGKPVQGQGASFGARGCIWTPKTPVFFARHQWMVTAPSLGSPCELAFRSAAASLEEVNLTHLLKGRPGHRVMLLGHHVAVLGCLDTHRATIKIATSSGVGRSRALANVFSQAGREEENPGYGNIARALLGLPISPTRPKVSLRLGGRHTGCSWRVRASRS